MVHPHCPSWRSISLRAFSSGVMVCWLGASSVRDAGHRTPPEHRYSQSTLDSKSAILKIDTVFFSHDHGQRISRLSRQSRPPSSSSRITPRGAADDGPRVGIVGHVKQLDSAQGNLLKCTGDSDRIVLHERPGVTE